MNEALYSLLSLGGILFISQLSPGPDFLLIFRTSLAQGWRAGTALGTGISIGFAIQVALVCTLGSRILEQGWSQYLLIGASLYLLYLAWHIFPRKMSSDAAQGIKAAGIEQSVEKDSIRTLLIRGFICNILNMKCMLFIVGITVNSLQSYREIDWYIPALIVWMSFVSVVGWSIWAGLLQWAPLRRGYRAHAWIIDLSFALILAAIAIHILLI